ncbi:MAG: beta-galactosidase [Spartobacteria bacterium]|nr:beta-galactosidase [Spartobacteria bacterium]
MYLGVDYYPEQWDASMMDADLQLMKAAGVNIVRLGEFAWHLMEPEEGLYDFSFFDQVIEKLRPLGIQVMFGTPTATFPAWLVKKYPDLVKKDEQLQRMAFGGRRQYCFNSRIYWEYTQHIVEKLVTHYKDEPLIISWQIDNELGHESSDMCYCEKCHAAFQEFLQKKYKTIDALNKRWGTVFWGQNYNDFDEIPLPTKTVTTHNPSLKLDYARFRSVSLTRYGQFQIDLVRKLKGSHQSVTTNLPGNFFSKYFDHEELVKDLDFASYDNYPVWGGLREPIPGYANAACLDFVRGLKDRNFWIVEELIGAQGHDDIGYLPRPGQAKMWAYQAFAHGCDNMLFFRWRGMTRGAEQFCYGVLDHDNIPRRKYEELKAVFDEMAPYENVVKSPVHADVAVMYDRDNVWSWMMQKQSSMFDFDTELLRFYRAFYDYNVNMDVVPVSRPFSSYRVVVLPVLQLVDHTVQQKAEAFVKQGGMLILSFRTGLKDRDNNMRLGEVLPGLFTELAGINVAEIEPLQAGLDVAIHGVGSKAGIISRCYVWREIIDCQSAEPLYVYDDPFFHGRACVTKNAYGKGTVYYVGGGIDADALQDLAMEIITDSSLDYRESDAQLEVIKRTVDGQTYLFCMNHTEDICHFDGIAFRPYESRVIKL